MFNRDWFHGGVNVGTPFGWDTKTYYGSGRMHPAQDYAPNNGRREKDIPKAILSGRMTWMIDAQGNSILRQIAGDFEARYYHFRRDELSSKVISAISVSGGDFVESGKEIGPVGNVGVSVAGPGNDGSHVHLVIICKYDKIDSMASVIGADWNKDKTEYFSYNYGDEFVLKAREWRIDWMNENVICRFDPLTQAKAYYLNARKILGA
jgi:murein DD-endopeptidase MepM/ murein hydrolase activator NlpD